MKVFRQHGLEGDTMPKLAIGGTPLGSLPPAAAGARQHWTKVDSTVGKKA
jgi:hypothetical protein